MSAENRSPDPDHPGEARPERPPAEDTGERESGGVFIMGAILLAAVVAVVWLFWGHLLKRRDSSDQMPSPPAASSRPGR
jgi:hypothetical protein